MISLDTNILARLLLADDATQYAQAKALLARDEEFTARATVMLELVWVLETYDHSPQEICRALLKLMGLPNFKPAHERELRAALELYEGGLDFADALHWQLSAKDGAFVTMDKKLVKKAAKLRPKDATAPTLLTFP
jgi:predicted nucleic-acid-binding protein